MDKAIEILRRILGEYELLNLRGEFNSEISAIQHSIQEVSKELEVIVDLERGEVVEI